MSTEEIYYHLIYKKLREGLDPEESRLLETWLNESEEHARIAAEIEVIFRADTPEPPAVDVPAELKAFKQRLRASENAPAPARLRIQTWWAAAAVLVAVLAAVVVFRTSFSPAEEWVTVASSGQPHEVSILPDSSRVWFNHPAELAYCMNAGGERKVRLKGEAFFEVKKDAARPFAVTAADCRVLVLGTSFNVRARAGDPGVEVSVRTGQVRVTAGKQQAELAPGQQALWVKTAGRLTVSTLDVAEVAEWRSPDLTFQNQPLGEVVRRLSRRFGQPVVLENAGLEKCPYTAYFPKAELPVILANLQAVFNVSTEKDTQGVRLRGGRCPQ